MSRIISEKKEYSVKQIFSYDSSDMCPIQFKWEVYFGISLGFFSTYLPNSKNSSGFCETINLFTYPMSNKLCVATF